MSVAYGMVKFKSTGNIYMCGYNGTSDIMIPFIFCLEDCRDAEGNYNVIEYARSLGGQSWKFPSECKDLDECEIYSSYGGGFYWNGMGSESARMIKEPINFCEDVEKYTDGVPAWVISFWEEQNDGNNGS